MVDVSKSALRRKAKHARASIDNPARQAVELLRHFPAQKYKGRRFAGFWPIGDEIDIRPLMKALYAQGENLCLPVTGVRGAPLQFYPWTTDTRMQSGALGTKEPVDQRHAVVPNFIFLPLLAYDASGSRLGYGGGYYDVTLSTIGESSEVFACGVAFDTQEQALIPTEPHDIHLDAILTPNGYTFFNK